MNTYSPYTPIDCGLYDYLESACLHAFELELELRDGTTARGVAKTMEVKHGAEFLVIEDGKTTRRFQLDTLARLRAKKQSGELDTVSFL